MQGSNGWRGGIMSAHGAHGGFVVTGGEFTPEARGLADACKIKLVDGAALEALIAHPKP